MCFLALKKRFVVKKFDISIHIALLLLRVCFGTAFIIHGYGKITNPFSWMGVGMNVPPILQFLAAASEFFGGIAAIFGVLMPMASSGIAFTMASAMYYHIVIKGDPFVSHRGGSWELAAIYFSVAFLLLQTGPGSFSLDAKLFGQKNK